MARSRGLGDVYKRQHQSQAQLLLVVVAVELVVKQAAQQELAELAVAAQEQL
jgi:hypothetical protein